MLQINVPWSEIEQISLSAGQASLAVVLILLYGGCIYKFGLITSEGEKNISHLGATLLLPCLLFTEMGPHATLDNLKHFFALPVFCAFFMSLSFVYGFLGQTFLGMPKWMAAACTFNNAVSLPLLLVTALEKAGGLRHLQELTDGDTAADIARRARVYILINALASNLLRFGFGPLLLKSCRGEQSELEEGEVQTASERTPLLSKSTPNGGPNKDVDPLASSITLHPYHADYYEQAKTEFVHAWHWIQAEFNPPLVGGFIAILAGIITPLRWLFFDHSSVVYGTFTASIEQIGQLYTALQMLALGAKLASKKNGKVKWSSYTYLFIWRFFIAPSIAIGVIYLMRTRTSLLKRDPVFDFILIFGSCGPPAITLSAIAEMSKVSEAEDAKISRLLTVSYIVTPLVAFSVAAALVSIEHSYSL